MSPDKYLYLARTILGQEADPGLRQRWKSLHDSTSHTMSSTGHVAAGLPEIALEMLDFLSFTLFEGSSKERRICAAHASSGSGSPGTKGGQYMPSGLSAILGQSLWTGYNGLTCAASKEVCRHAVVQEVASCHLDVSNGLLDLLLEHS